MIVEKHGRLFEVAMDGSVERLPFRDARGVLHKRRKLAVCTNRDGYRVIYGQTDGIRWGEFQHRLLAECFIPRRDGCDQVNHINGDKSDNRLENLEWVTPSENASHAIRTGLSKSPKSGPGERSPAAKLSQAEVAVIKRRLASGEQYRKIAAEYGVAPGTIGHIKYGKTWTHVEAAP